VDIINATQYLYYEGNGKAIAVQAWTVAEDSKGLGLPDFMMKGT